MTLFINTHITVYMLLYINVLFFFSFFLSYYSDIALEDELTIKIDLPHLVCSSSKRTPVERCARTRQESSTITITSEKIGSRSSLSHTNICTFVSELRTRSFRFERFEVRIFKLRALLLVAFDYYVEQIRTDTCTYKFHDLARFS